MMRSASRVRPRISARATLAALALAGPLALPALTASPGQAAVAKPGPLSVAYVEVNNDDIANVGNYTLASTGANVFDIAVIFAANINYDGSKAVLSFNPQVQAVLDNAATEIAPLQAKGIKVYLSILGNHQGAGVSNFPDQSSAAAFAQTLADTETRYGLDGIDFDDEYADYGTNGTGQPNAWSFPYLVQELRDDAPAKGISFYDYGPAANSLSYDGINVGSLINYSYNAIYGTWSVPNVPGTTKAQLSPAAVDIRNTSSATAASLASQTVSNGYGMFMTYNLPNGNDAAYVSSFTQKLYGSAAVYTPPAGSAPSGAITNTATGTCVNAPSTSSSTQLQLATCNGAVGESWTFPGDGTIRNQGKCMDVRTSGTTSGTPVQIFDCNQTPAQQWTYDAVAKTYKDFSGLCLDKVTSGGFLGKVTSTVVATCNGSTGQQWSHP